MSKKRNEQRLSLRESRQNSKIERLLKFIQSNSPVKITHPGSPNPSSNPNPKPKQLTSPKQRQHRQYKEQLNEVINNFLDRKIEAKRSQSRQVSATHHGHVYPHTNTGGSLGKRSGKQDKQGKQDKGKKRQNLLLPLLRIVKTEEAVSSLCQVGEMLSNMHVLGSKKYESLLMLPKHNHLNPSKNPQNPSQKLQKTSSHTKQKSHRTPPTPSPKAEMNYTGWQIDHREFMEEMQTNFY